MPIYEYECQKCGVFEVTQRITDAPLKKCPTCGNKTERVISRTSFVLKGSGWYITDYARAGQNSKKSGESDSSAESATKSIESASASESKSSRSESSSKAASDSQS